MSIGCLPVPAHVSPAQPGDIEIVTEGYGSLPKFTDSNVVQDRIKRVSPHQAHRRRCVVSARGRPKWQIGRRGVVERCYHALHGTRLAGKWLIDGGMPNPFR